MKFFLSALCSLVFASCSKSDNFNNSGSIVGTWTFSEVGVDNNSNHIIDAGETSTVAQIGAYGSLTFRSDDTYSSTFFDGANQYDESGTYTYSTGFIKTTTGTDTGTFNEYKVLTITNNRLVVEHTTSFPGNWIILTK